MPELSKWEFTEEEKVILRNLPKEYKWITRNSDDDLSVFVNQPTKYADIWCGVNFDDIDFDFYNHIFNSIKWEDDEPCEFRKYI